VCVCVCVCIRIKDVSFFLVLEKSVRV